MTRISRSLAVFLAAWLLAAAWPALAQEARPGVAWDALSVEQQQLFERFRDGWDELPPQRQQAMVAGSYNFV